MFKNDKKKYLFTLIIPIFLIFFSLQLKNSKGPYYLNMQYDPSYFYLMNSLNLAQMKGYGVGHYDHPGTPVQVLGAVVVKIFYILSSEHEFIVKDVIYRPEIYLNALDIAFIILNALGLYVLGLVVYNNTRKIIVSLIFQLAPFISITISYSFTDVKPENLIIFIMSLLLSLLVKFVYDENLSGKKIVLYTIGFGILCGLGIATKLNFIPIIFIPLILIQGIYKKIMFLAITFFSFVFFVLPAISNLNYFIDWVTNLFLHTGQYGRGKADIINWSTFLIQIIKIFYKEIFFAIVYLLILSTIFLLFIYKRKNNSFGIKNSREIRVLIAIFFSINIQILFVAKMFSQHYMIPALILTIVGLYFAVSLIVKKYSLNFDNVFNTLFIIITIFVITISIRALFWYSEYSNEAKKIKNFIAENYPQAVVITTSKSSSEVVALMYGSSSFYAGKASGNYMLTLSERFPDQIFYHLKGNIFYSPSGSIDFKKIILSGEKILLQNAYEEFNNNFLENLSENYNIENVKLEKVFSNANGESLYELNFNQD